ncbi:MAG TPA: hypothetical protein VIY86_14335 [Pirellulaceae bacterium]
MPPACLPVFLGSVAAVVICGLGLIAWLVIQRAPPLTRDGFDRARRIWTQVRPGSYRVQTTVTGRQGATYLVEVRDGVPVSAARNGNPLPQERVWRTWTVDGMFDTMHADVRMRERREKTQDFSLPDLILRAEFDPTSGIPRRYVRIDRRSPLDVTWRIDSFENLSGPPTPSDAIQR